MESGLSQQDKVTGSVKLKNESKNEKGRSLKNSHGGPVNLFIIPY